MLTKKVAVITGAGSGIGEATARVLAEEGAKVVIGDITESAKDVAEHINLNRGESIFVHCDVTNEESVRNLMETAYGLSNLQQSIEPVMTKFVRLLSNKDQ